MCAWWKNTPLRRNYDTHSPQHANVNQWNESISWTAGLQAYFSSAQAAGKHSTDRLLRRRHWPNSHDFWCCDCWLSRSMLICTFGAVLVLAATGIVVNFMLRRRTVKPEGKAVLITGNACFFTDRFSHWLLVFAYSVAYALCWVSDSDWESVFGEDGCVRACVRANVCVREREGERIFVCVTMCVLLLLALLLLMCFAVWCVSECVYMTVCERECVCMCVCVCW